MGSCCSTCGCVFLEPESRVPCPKCGSETRTFQLHLEGQVQFHGKLVACKPPTGANTLPPLEKRANDSLTLTAREAVVAHGQGEGTEAIRLSDDQAQSVAADLLMDGTSNLAIRGKGRRGEEGVKKVCEILIARLNQGGACWSEPKDLTGPEQGVDYEAHDGTKILKIQVTRAIQDQELWMRLAKAGERTKQYQTADEAADELRDAIKAKEKIPPGQRKEITLALDATETPGQVFQLVVKSFQGRHGSWSRRLGFGTIWVVGPIAELTFRLDLDPME